MANETIGQRLERLRTDLARVQELIARIENNGLSWNMGGTSMTQASYESAQKREKRLLKEIAGLEARLAGSTQAPGIARTQTRMD